MKKRISSCDANKNFYVLCRHFLLCLCVTLTACGMNKGVCYTPNLDNPELISITECDNKDQALNMLECPQVEGGYISSVRTVGDDIYVFAEFSEDGAQFAYKYAVYKLEGDTYKEYYSTEDVRFVTEFTSSGHYLFWVENGMNGNGVFEYRIVKSDVYDGSVSVIASRDENAFSIPVLSSDERYLAWYDVKPSTNDVVLQVIDIDKNEYVDTPKIKRASASLYSRAEIAEGGITFFTESDDQKILLSRYNPTTKKLVSVCVSKDNNIDKLAGGFSNERFFGWFTDYYGGSYYIYDTSLNKLYRLEGVECLDVFTRKMTKDSLYLASDNSLIYRVNLDNMNITVEELEGDPGRFFVGENGSLCIETRKANINAGFTVISE